MRQILIKNNGKQTNVTKVRCLLFLFCLCFLRAHTAQKEARQSHGSNDSNGSNGSNGSNILAAPRKDNEKMWPCTTHAVAVLLLSVLAVSPQAATAKVVILHEAHEGSHATCEAFAHLCVATDCREIHDARSTRDIDWPFIESSDDELFLLRFYPIISAAHPFLNHTVIFLVREDLFHWGLGTYHTQFRHEPRAEPGSPVHINGTNLLHVWKKRVRANRARACMLCELRWPLSCPD